ncbi:hypothetical protein DICSQDRAFT_156465 [Dichomitus squalens LYAD-421 SS1]|uniref:Uncharacterized protein n=1 Tax=Dichomitus squalens (strain LYAD-421) TaxID=732165 RepID=R7SSR0_DICSQ|nr:uncharacterized protein DICSQDRAFT_156465 [Dichomitus squalens LYAD-421 SS1]EJF59106.1 hypothetical protein DICSQDRAFT_156465 [Dichomitus squalens LYAD-421 SS1]
MYIRCVYLLDYTIMESRHSYIHIHLQVVSLASIPPLYNVLIWQLKYVTSHSFSVVVIFSTLPGMQVVSDRA